MFSPDGKPWPAQSSFGHEPIPEVLQMKAGICDRMVPPKTWYLSGALGCGAGPNRDIFLTNDDPMDFTGGFTLTDKLWDPPAPKPYKEEPFLWIDPPANEEFGRHTGIQPGNVQIAYHKKT